MYFMTNALTLSAKLLAAVLLIPSFAHASEGCSSRGGPGYRLTNGKCVSWAQHEKHKAVGDFPAGAACEHPNGCTLETSVGVKRLEHGALKAAQ